MKNIILFLILAAFVASCNSSNKQSTTNIDSTLNVSANVMTLTIDDFCKDPSQFVGKLVQIEGTVIHTCKHGGKKMFIANADNDSLNVKITSADNMPPFNESLEGSMVTVEGTVEQIAIEEDDHDGDNHSTANESGHDARIHATEYEYSILYTKVTENDR